MKNLLSKLSVAAMAGIVSLSLVGCGTPTVDLNEYVSVNTNGYSGYGKFSVSVDYNRIVEDFRSELNPKAGNEIFGADSPALAAELAFDMYEPFELEYEVPENLTNGDKIAVKWDVNENAVKRVQEVLDVKFRHSDFSHTVEDLQELRQVDPFEYVQMQYWGISGNAEVNTNVDAKIPHDNGTLTIDLDIPYTKGLSNGDTVHAVLDDRYDAEYYARNFGMVLTRKEADMVVEGAAYYPLSDYNEILEYLTEEDLKNAETAVLEHFQDYKGNISAEYVGAVLYYSNEIDVMNCSQNKNNQLVLIWHMDNGICPGGWYTYMGVWGDVYIRYLDQNDTSAGKETVQGGSPFGDNSWNYRRENITYYGSPDYPTHFEYDGLYYAGHRTVAECLEAVEANMIYGGHNCNKYAVEDGYEVKLVTDSLKSYLG